MINWSSDDFIYIEFIPFKLPKISKNDTIVFTSKNAVKSFFQQIKNRLLTENKIICVGKKTAKEIEQRQLQVNYIAPTSKSLGEWVVKNNKNSKIIHFCGNIKREELKEITTQNNIAYQEIEVYQTTLTPKKINSNINGVLFLSPSAVKSFITLNKSKDKIAFCIGETTATEAKKYFDEVQTSNNNSLESSLKFILKYYKNV